MNKRMCNFLYYASYVIVDLRDKIAVSFKDDPAEARALLGLMGDIEAVYPNAAKEVARYEEENASEL